MERRDIFQNSKLQVGVRFTRESMESISRLLEGLDFKKNGSAVPGGDVLFNSSAGLFDFEPVLKSLRSKDNVPMSDALVDLQHPSCPELTHGGLSFDDLPQHVKEAIGTDSSQREALNMMLQSKVVLVQGPPGTGKVSRIQIQLSSWLPQVSCWFWAWSASPSQQHNSKSYLILKVCSDMIV